jgi:hypothetical protein
MGLFYRRYNVYQNSVALQGLDARWLNNGSRPANNCALRQYTHPAF